MTATLTSPPAGEPAGGAADAPQPASCPPR